MEARSILIIGNYGAGNLGDDAILGGILCNLRTAGFTGRIRVTHGGIKSSRDIYKDLECVPFVPSGLRSRWNTLRSKGFRKKEALKAIQNSDLIILGGGGLFTDGESLRAPYIWSVQAKAVQKLKKPYICYGQSLGPLKTFLGRYWAKQTFTMAKAVHVRDQESADLLEKWGIKASVGTDPAFSWLLEKRRNIPRQSILLVSLRLWPGIKEKDWEPLIKEINVFAKRRKLKPVLISMDLRNQREALAFKNTRVELFEPQSALEAFEGFEKSTLAVTMRLHACIFALAGQTPFLGLSYSQKVKAVLQKLKLSGGVKLLFDLNTEKFREALKELSPERSGGANIKNHIMQNQAFLAQQLADL